MAYTRKDYAGAAADTTLAAGINGSDTSISITASTGWPSGLNGPFVAVIDPGTASEEKVLVTSRTGTTLNTVTRGYDGTAQASHSSGATIRHCISATDMDEANYAVAQTVGKVTSAGDLLVGSSANTLARLAKGSASTVLRVDSGGTLAYGTITSAMIADGTVTGTDIASGTITSSNIADGTIVNADINASAAIALSKLATDPLARANHTGTQTASTISDFDTQVRTSRLDQMAAPSGSVSLNSQKITSLGTPSASTDAVTKTYADTISNRAVLNRQVMAVTGGGLSYSSGAQVGTTITITDPGYDIYVWGHATMAPYTSGQTVDYSVWLLEVLVDNTAIDRLRVPFSKFLPAAISLGVPLRSTTHSTGSNCTVKLRVTRDYGDGTLSLDADSTYNCLQVYWTKQ